AAIPEWPWMGYAAFNYDPRSGTFTPVTAADWPPQQHDAKRGVACQNLAAGERLHLHGICETVSAATAGVDIRTQPRSCGVQGMPDERSFEFRYRRTRRGGALEQCGDYKAGRLNDRRPMPGQTQRLIWQNSAMNPVEIVALDALDLLVVVDN